MKLSLPLQRAIDPDLAADVEKQAVYAAPELRKLRVVDGTSVEIECEDGASEDALRGKLERYLQTMVAKYRKLDRKALQKMERRDRAPLQRSVYEELKRRGWVLELGRGQLGLAGPALAVARAVEQQAAKLGREQFAAVEESYPALIPADVLARCGYFASFPQAVSLVAHLVEDYDLIEEFRQANASAPRLTIPRAGAIPTPEACLTPAVCYHCYQSLEGRTLDERGHHVTSLGRCFRYESKNITGLDRLWDFTMREVIWVGTEAHVVAQRARAIELVAEQVRAWDLDAVIETANDPFFPTVHATKTYWQVRSDLKFELRFAVEPSSAGDARTVAAGSFNLHENFFGKTFAITASDGQPAFTGCVGWGLERWVLAAFTQHGYDGARWPAELRAEIFS